MLRAGLTLGEFGIDKPSRGALYFKSLRQRYESVNG
jgi:hypothetical protein